MNFIVTVLEALIEDGIGILVPTLTIQIHMLQERRRSAEPYFAGSSSIEGLFVCSRFQGGRAKVRLGSSGDLVSGRHDEEETRSEDAADHLHD